MPEFASLSGREVPFDGGSFGIALPLPSHDLRADRREVWQAPIQALAAEHAQLALRQVQPTAVLG
jgi:hypothetical protein